MKSRTIKVSCQSANAGAKIGLAPREFGFTESGMTIQEFPISQIKLNPHNARTHSREQIRQIADSISAFGFTTPPVVNEDVEAITGHGRLEAAKLLGLKTIPVIVVAGLSPAKQRALAIADNKIAENAGWDRERLALEIPELAELLSAEGLDVSLLGFEPIEIARLETEFKPAAPSRRRNGMDPDGIDPRWSEASVVSRTGDLWGLGDHKLLCGDARCAADVARLMAGGQADLAFLDLARDNMTGHSESAMAGLSSADFVRFLSGTLDAAAAVSRPGALHFVCMDRQHIAELLAAAEPIYGKAIDVAVWERPKASPRSLYRSELEHIGVFGVGKPPHLETGRGRRSRSNIWRYPAVTGAGDALHPTAKPVALIADAIKDGTRKGEVVLDTVAGAGTMIMAAEQVGRQARALEIEPRLVDLAIRRWQAFTHQDAIHAESALSFDEIAARSGHAITPIGNRGERK